MANLPIELWHFIFDHLQLADLSSCALVNKTLYLTMKAYRIREIAFTRRLYQWFHYATPTIDHKHRIDFSMSSILQNSPFNFDHLKRLKIGRLSAIDLNVINKFARLEELNIDLWDYKNEQSRTLSLANLKVLYLFMNDHLSYVELDTPRLAKVCTFSLKRLEFIYPESIRCIHTFCHYRKLAMFQHLECLILTDHYNQLDYLPYVSQSFEEFSVRNLRKLKEVDFFYNSNQYQKKNMSMFKRITANFLALERPDLKVFWFHVQMTDMSVLTEYELNIQNAGSLLAFQLQHYEKLKEKVYFFWSYDFNGSMKKLPIAGFNVRSEEFTSKFFARYSFRRIHVNGQVEERELLLELIARSSGLFALEFLNSDLDQSFFDRIPDIVRLNAIPLQELQFVGASNGLANFDFVLRLRDLEVFTLTNQPLPSELISKLLRLPLLTHIKYSSDGIVKRIDRLSTNRFHLNKEPLNLQELLEHFNIKHFDTKSDSNQNSEIRTQIDSSQSSKASKCRPM